jgi:hypothetical protein
MKPEQDFVSAGKLLAWPPFERRDVVMTDRPAWKTPPSARKVCWLTGSALHQQLTNRCQSCPA